LLTLIDEILDLAKIESGNMSLSLEPVGLTQLLAEVAIMVEEQAAQRGIRMLYPEPDPTMAVQADHTRLKQIILNLLSNAIKYNRKGGAVVLNIVIGSSNRIKISIQDTGNGLSQDQIEALFQPFNRLGQEAGSQEGTGIGLVVTKRLVELMNGTMGVTSTVGVGSVFWIELEKKYPEQIQQNQAYDLRTAELRHCTDRNMPVTILYIEDNPASLRLVEEIIGFRPDLTFISAVDAISGIALAQSQRPNVILMDINLPGMSGNEAKRVLGADERTAHIPVIALTANAMTGDIKKGMAAGFVRYLTKPIEVDVLLAAIDDALSSVLNEGGESIG
jgi:protein-histidine pros-kinase